MNFSDWFFVISVSLRLFFVIYVIFSTIRTSSLFQCFGWLNIYVSSREGSTNLVPFEISRSKKCVLVMTVRNHASSYLKDVCEVLEAKIAFISEYLYCFVFSYANKLFPYVFSVVYKSECDQSRKLLGPSKLR